MVIVGLTLISISIYTHRHNDKRRHSRPRVIRVLLHESGINDKDNTVNSDGRLGDVRGKDDFSGAFRCWFENLGLHFARKVGVNGTNDELCNLVAQRASRLLQVFMAGFNLFLAL